MRKKLVERSKCQGCRNCELACVAAHAPGGNLLLAYAEGAEKSPRSRNKVEIDPEGRLFPQFCRHCDVSAALLRGLPDGRYRQERRWICSI